MSKQVRFWIMAGAVGLLLLASWWILPLFLCLAFNFMDGIRANEEGITFIPWGIFSTVLTLVGNGLALRKAVLLTDEGKNRRILVALLVIACVVGIVLSRENWWFFFENLTYFKGMNLELQR